MNVDSISLLLARAFFDDPLFCFFFPDSASRLARACYTFRFISAHAGKRGRVTLSERSGAGACIWLPSNAIDRNLMDQIRFGALAMVFKQGRQAISRQDAASRHMKSLHHKLLPEPHLYLSTIGVDPQFRGQGVAGSLLAPLLAEADESGHPIYLDTHNAKNIEFYRRFGFGVVHHGPMPESRISHWAMVRWPNAF